MRLSCLVLAGILTAPPLVAQEATATSSESAQASTAKDDLPVPLDRIREGLKKAPRQPLLQGLDRQADFRVEVREQAKIDELLSKLDFKSGPAPAGGLYAYEQQRRLFSATSRPLMQPYAAFSGSELITIALENLIARHLGGRLVSALTSGAGARAEAAAREEVDQAVADYCAQRPDRDSIRLCTSPPAR